MLTISKAKEKIMSGECDPLLVLLYGTKIEMQKSRILSAIEAFSDLFGSAREIAVFSAPGRTEIGGNHTDHNGGRVLAGSVDLDVIAICAKTEEFSATVHSKGFSPDLVLLSDLEKKPDEVGKSASLLRGVARGLSDRGYALGGFVAYTESSVPKGSGVSSSAAFEVLLGSIWNHLYNEGVIGPMEIAKISQFAERKYFGKPCGLMDQAASAVGGISMMDFSDEENPVAEPIPFSFAESGHKICLVNVGGDHADLTDLYAAIPARMKAVARLFGKDLLCRVEKEEFFEKLALVREKLGDEATLSAMHFFLDSERVLDQKEALLAGDFARFLDLVKRSGHSSFEALGNVWIPKEGACQGAAIALNLAAEILDGKGAFRIHGGGFGGTTQNFVPDEKVPEFCETMEAVFGKGACSVLSIRPVGPVRIL